MRRKSIALLLSIALVVSLFSQMASAGEIVYGDVDGDGIVSARDSAIVARFVAQWSGYVREDGVITFPGDPANPAADHDTDSFATGYSQMVITPRTNGTIPMAGYANTYTRRATGTLDDLKVSCIAMRDDEGNTVLLLTLDLIGLVQPKGLVIRELVSRRTGIPTQNIFLCCTHTHTGPDVSSNLPGMLGGATRYMISMSSTIADCCEAAIDDLDASTIKIGSTQVENLTFVRRYKVLYTAASNHGSVYGWEGPNSTDTVSRFIEHETEADDEAQYILFERANQKDILLFNWQCHPDQVGGYLFSSDYINAARNTLESRMDVYAAFFEGAAGNLNQSDSLGVRRTKSYDASQELGATVGNTIATAAQASGGLTEVPSGTVQAMEIQVPLDYNRNEEDIATVIAWRQSQFSETLTNEEAEELLVAQAQAVKTAYADGGSNSSSPLYSAARKTCYQQTGVSVTVYYCSSIVNRSNYPEGQRMLPIGVCSVGQSIGFIAAPYEMFDTSGKTIKDGIYLSTSGEYSQGPASPFSMTFICEQANGREGYVPTAYAVTHGGYECYVTHFKSGAAETLVQNFLNMLNTLYDAAE